MIQPLPGAATMLLPYLTDSIPQVDGAFQKQPSNFHVEEIPAYLPTGSGEHLFIQFEKQGLSTPDAVRLIAKALNCNPEMCGWAGLKDRHATTTQWASFFQGSVKHIETVCIPQIRIIEAGLHPHKLRTGHLRGNCFRLRLSHAYPHLERVTTIIDLLRNHGVPNYYTEQRFGIDNLARAKHWLIDNHRAPRSRFERKLLVSVLQSAAFNAVLTERVRHNELSTAIDGDLFQKESTGGLFTTSDLNEAQSRLDQWDISPTGPMFGTKMRWPETTVLAREQAIKEQWGLDTAVLQRCAIAGKGTRRALRVALSDTEVTQHPDNSNDLELRFRLPAGSYATAVLREILKSDKDTLAAITA